MSVTLSIPMNISEDGNQKGGESVMSQSGKAQTVLGLIEPSALGCTLAHEHIKMNYQSHYQKPKRASDLPKTMMGPPTLETLGWIRQNPYSHIFNLCLGEDPFEDVVKELKMFRNAGGSTIVECTTIGMMQDIEYLKHVSIATGLNIIAGTGYSDDAAVSGVHKNTMVEHLTERMITEITRGVDDMGIKCGLIGEVGTSWPVTPFERKSLQSSSEAQQQTGAPISIHPGRSQDAPREVIRILQESNADLSRTIMCHLDRSVVDREKLLEVAGSGCYLEYDFFGIDVSYYQTKASVDIMSDAQAIQEIKFLISEGYEDKIMISHNIHCRHHLVKYGGHGYAHININTIPQMLEMGIAQEVIDKIQIENPRTLFTFK